MDQTLLLPLDQQAKHHGPFDTVLMTTPPREAYRLTSDWMSVERDIMLNPMKPCVTLNMTLESPLKQQFILALVKHRAISLISQSHTKPGRQGSPPVLTVLTTNQAAKAKTHCSDDSLIDLMIAETEQVLQETLPKISHIRLTRWQEANQSVIAPPNHYWDSGYKLGLCGDGYRSGTVEGAFKSVQGLLQSMEV